MADHKTDQAPETTKAEKRKAYKALLKKHGAEKGTAHLKGSRRAECKAALNWLHHNPAPKKRTSKKKEG